MAVQISKLRAVKRLMDAGCSIEDYSPSCKLKLGNFGGVEMRGSVKIYTIQVEFKHSNQTIERVSRNILSCRERESSFEQLAHRLPEG